MARDVNNLIFEHMRDIRSKVYSIDQRGGRLELRFGLIENQVGNLHVSNAGQNVELDCLRARVDRIERRLELGE